MHVVHCTNGDTGNTGHFVAGLDGRHLTLEDGGLSLAHAALDWITDLKVPLWLRFGTAELDHEHGDHIDMIMNLESLDAIALGLHKGLRTNGDFV